MKAITKYQADDGSEWDTKEKCLEYESLCTRVAAVMSALPALPNDGDFTNGHGYMQLSKPLVVQVRNQLLDIIGERIEHPWVEQSRDPKIHPSYVSRVLDDYGIRPLMEAWNRLLCVDNHWREWGQPYFAEHPDKGEQRQIA